MSPDAALADPPLQPARLNGGFRAAQWRFVVANVHRVSACYEFVAKSEGFISVQQKHPIPVVIARLQSYCSPPSTSLVVRVALLAYERSAAMPGRAPGVAFQVPIQGLVPPPRSVPILLAASWFYIRRRCECAQGPELCF